MEHENDGDTNSNWCPWYSHQRIDTGTGGLGKPMTSKDHPNNNIFLDRPEYLEECGKLEENCCHSKSSEKPSAYAGAKNSQKTNNDRETILMSCFGFNSETLFKR